MTKNFGLSNNKGKSEQIMNLSFDDIENAFFFVNSDQKFMNNAILCRETGQIFYVSALVGSEDELPEDLEDPDKYINIPHKSNLGLGRNLVTEFTKQYLPEEIDRVYSIFRGRGAYSKYKKLLDSKGFLDKWFEFEDARQKAALKEWCRLNKIRYTDKPI
jgi:hypothetical protein